MIYHNDMALLPEKPFFIVGHPRSGTTLLRFILSSHPRIYIPEETGFIPFLPYRKKPELSYPEFIEILTRIGSLNFLWKNIVSSPRNFYESLPVKNLATVLDALYRIQIGPFSAIRWGDKTPLYVQYLKEINEIFPQAQFIHLIRDGRDTLLSARKKWPKNRYYKNGYYLIQNWARNVAAGRQAADWLGPERYIEIRYEDLILAPLTATQKICTFLNESFSETMLDHTQLARKVGPGPDNHREILEPISQNSINRWKLEMPLYERKMTQRTALNVLRECGYEIEPLPSMSWRESIRFARSRLEFFLLDSFRGILYKTGLLTLNRTMRKKKTA